MHPGYFALVMATGIVALGALQFDLFWIAGLLFWLNALFLLCLVGATVLRVLRYPRAFLADLQDHSRGVGFYTTVAAFGVFGAQLVLQQHALGLATACLVVTGTLWLVIMYGILAALTVQTHKPDLEHGLNGGWLVMVVATQAVAVLTVLVLSAGGFPDSQQHLMFLALIFWLGGGALYLWLIPLIFYRYTFVTMSPEDLVPPYWINMGAVAISTLAGTGVWRHLIRGVTFRYDPHYWSGVFPMGMYAACTFHLTQVMPLTFLTELSRIAFFVALAAWLATLIGMIDSLLDGFRRSSNLLRAEE